METALDPSVEAARSLRHRIAIPVAAAFIVAAAVGGVLWARSDEADRTVHVGNPAVSTTTAAAPLGPAKNGWIALDNDGAIYLVRPGEDPAGSRSPDRIRPTMRVPHGRRTERGCRSAG